MVKTIKKTFADFDKETQWLNQMSADGYALAAYKGGRYTFEEAQPNHYLYTIELLRPGDSAKNEQYLAFLREMQIDVIATYAGRAYLRKKNDGTAFTLHSDVDAKIAYYQKGYAIWATISSSQIAMSAYLLFYAIQLTPSAGVAFYITATFSSLLCLSGILLITILGKPYRQKIRALKREKTIRE